MGRDTHILVFLHKDDNYSLKSDIDRIISAQISNQKEDPIVYKEVKSFMIHVPCGLAKRTLLACKMENAQNIFHNPLIIQ